MNELTYVPLDDTHAESLLSIWVDEDVIKFTNIKSNCNLKDANERINRLKAFDTFVVIQNEVVIGVIGCPCINKEKLQYGLFYQFDKSVWGKGVATISTKWLLEFMKHKYSNVTIYADVVVDNIASEKILNKFDFKLISKEPFQKSGRLMKIHNYIKQIG